MTHQQKPEKKHCKNCSELLQGRFCHNCGQKAKTERITIGLLWHDLFHFFTHIESGFLFTTLRMFTTPGTVIKEYVEGKRIRYQRPVSYFLIWVATWALLLFAFEKIFGNNTVIYRTNYFSNATDYAFRHINIITAIMLPINTFYLFAIAMHRYYNYFECFVATLYIQGTIFTMQVFFGIACLVYYLVTGNSVNLAISDVLKSIFVFGICSHLLLQYKLTYRFFRMVTIVIASTGTFLFWRMYGLPLLAGNLF